jgi:putative DNA primase/helicase
MIDDVTAVFRALQGMSAYGLTKSKCEDIIHAVIGLTDTVNVRANPEEIPCKSYLYNDRTGEKIPYGKGVYVTSLGNVDYNPAAANPHFHNNEDGADWDFDSWLLDLFDGDEEMVEFFWQIVARLIRPFRPATGIVLFTATTGNNGKGTLVSLFRELVGNQAWASVPIAEFAERFGLKDLIYAYVILTDENRMEYNFDGADRLKAAADGSVFKVEIRYKGYINLRFPGLMIQCVNELPRIKDKSGSWYRRLAVVPFNKSFTGHERKYIKDDYLKRSEVLEYVKKRAIETKVEDIDLHDLMPEKCIAALEDYKIMNDPVRQYWDEFSSRFVWNKIPLQFLYDLYCNWYMRNNPNGRAASKTVFKKQLAEIIQDDPGWINKLEQNDKIRRDQGTAPAEPLILEYGLAYWYNPYYRGTNPAQRITGANIPDMFRGLVKVTDNRSKGSSEKVV